MKLLPKDNFNLFPNAIIGGYLKKLGPHAFSFFAALWFRHHRFSTPSFARSDEQLANEFGLSPRSLSRLRKRLREEGFIDYKVGYRFGEKAKATRYLILPDEGLRKSFQIPDPPEWPSKQGKHRWPKRLS